jgi:DNA-binding transcriptional ArsR family regulator
MNDDDLVFKALADPTRRFLLDRLFERDGRTLTELESELEMTRFGVMKHLRVLEQADLVVTRRSGREKLHFLNPVPIRLIHDRWIDKYTERRVSALTKLKSELEASAGQPPPRPAPRRSTASTSTRRPRRSGTRSPIRSGPTATATEDSSSTSS